MIYRGEATRSGAEPRLAERVLRAVYDTSPDVIFVHAQDGTVLDVNDRLFDMYGYERTEIVGRAPVVLMGGGMDAAAAADLLERALRGEAVRTDAWVARKKDGTEFPVEVRLRRLEVEDDDPPRVLATVRDLSEERARADALRRSETRYRAMFEKNRAVKLLIDPDEARVIDANPAAEEMYGYTTDELRGMSVASFNTRSLDVIKAAMQQAKGERQSHFRFRHRRKDGQLLDVEVYSSPIELEGKTVLYSIVHDISEQKRLEQQLTEAQKMEALGRLAAEVAHDFGNLMQVVVASSELAHTHLTDDHPAAQLLEDVRYAGSQAASLTSQLLAFGRRQVLAPRPLELNGALGQMSSMLRSVVGPRVRVLSSFSERPARVMADPAQLEHVLLNLALNARDAMPEGGTIRIRTGHTTLHDGEIPAVPAGRYVQLEVEDDGVGIPPEHLPFIFEPFFSKKEKGRGTGLGLAMVYGVVSQSGGHVAATSEPGRGTTFRILLPEIALPSDEPASRERPAPAKDDARTALLVDDDDVVRRVLKLTLEQLGWRVLAAPDGERAEELAAAHPANLDVLITDVRMPGLGGHRLAARVRELRPEASVLYISGGVEAADLPADDPRVAFLHKPVSPEDLRRTLTRIVMT